MDTYFTIVKWVLWFAIFSCAYSAAVFVTLGVLTLRRKIKG